MDTPVPIVKTFDEVYPDDAKQTQEQRWNELLSSFVNEYQQKPDFVSRSPGRVNIIGEVCNDSSKT